jgi:colicin import membrane protein
MSTKTLPSRARRSKADVQSEFNQIRENRAEEQQERTPKDQELARLREQEIQELTQNITTESVVQRLGTLELEVAKAISGLSSRLLTESKLLQTLREAVALEQAQIERLHQIDIAKTSMDQLIQEHEQVRARLDAEMNEARVQWIAEQEQKEKETKLFDEELKRRRAREEEQYGYDQDQERKRAEMENAEKQAALDKAWAAREAALKEREEELTRLRAESAGSAERLKKEVDRAVAESAKALQLEHRQAFVIAQKDTETERRLAELKIKSLEEIVVRQAEEIKSLTARVEESKTQVQEIAIKAIESTSGARALSHINQIAMEQAKTRSSTQS